MRSMNAKLTGGLVVVLALALLAAGGAWLLSPSQAWAQQNRLPRVTIATTVTEVTEGALVAFTFTRTGSTTDALAVKISVSDPGSTLRGNHWDPAPVVPTWLTFAAGSSTATLLLKTKDDLRDIPDSVLTVSLLPEVGYIVPGVGVNSVGVTVMDNDAAPRFRLSVNSDSVEEGGTLTFTLRRISDASAGAYLRVVLGYEGELTEHLFTLLTGVSERTWKIETDDNDLDEPDRVYEFSVLPHSGIPSGDASEYWTIDGPSTVSATVRDNDLPLVWVEAHAPSYQESHNAWFVINRVGNEGRSLSVNAITTQTGHDLNPDLSYLLDRTQEYAFSAGSTKKVHPTPVG